MKIPKYYPPPPCYPCSPTSQAMLQLWTESDLVCNKRKYISMGTYIVHKIVISPRLWTARVLSHLSRFRFRFRWFRFRLTETESRFGFGYVYCRNHETETETTETSRNRNRYQVSVVHYCPEMPKTKVNVLKMSAQAMCKQFISDSNLDHRDILVISIPLSQRYKMFWEIWKCNIQLV